MTNLGFYSFIIVLILIFRVLYRLTGDSRESKYLKVGLLIGLFVFLRLILNDDIDKTTPWMIAIGVTFVAWIFANTDFTMENSDKFRSSKPNIDRAIESMDLISSIHSYGPKEFTKFTNKDFRYYVRFTIYESILNERIMIFDSSDYEVINEVLEVSRNYQPELKKGNHISIFGKEYRIENISVDLLNV